MTSISAQKHVILFSFIISNGYRVRKPMVLWAKKQAANKKSID